MTPADRPRGPIDEVVVDPNGRHRPLLINEDPADDVVIDWPAALGPIEALDVIGFAGDGRSLLLAHGTTERHRPLPGRRPGRPGRRRPARRPAAERLVHLEDAGCGSTWRPMAAGRSCIDRVDNVRLVRLSDGRTWPIDRDRTLVWVGAAG